MALPIMCLISRCSQESPKPTKAVLAILGGSMRVPSWAAFCGASLVLEMVYHQQPPMA